MTPFIPESSSGKPGFIPRKTRIVRTQGARPDRDYLVANAPALEIAELLERALVVAGADR